VHRFAHIRAKNYLLLQKLPCQIPGSHSDAAAGSAGCLPVSETIWMRSLIFTTA
jgi:hypothetical protein